MSAVLEFQEPNRVSAGLMALAVHLMFFALLYFGVRWQHRPQDTFMVEMWASLPETEVAPARPPEPTPVPHMEPTPPPKVVKPVLPSVKPEIKLRDKKAVKPKEKEKPVKKEDAKVKAAEKARQEAELKELEAYSSRQEASKLARLQAERDRQRAEVSAANRALLEGYQDKIRNKIRRKMVKQDVPDSAEAIFKVTLLPDGMLMDDPVLLKSSGYPAYDNAAARAIISAEPLPVPEDPNLQKEFRELKLKIQP